ncbi:MAG: hypothetical protein Q4A43_03565 [Coriobacteriia bacterium]|nr:hypothetical protein [Coriobacteriia bacterium]
MHSLSWVFAPQALAIAAIALGLALSPNDYQGFSHFLLIVSSLSALSLCCLARHEINWLKDKRQLQGIFKYLRGICLLATAAFQLFCLVSGALSIAWETSVLPEVLACISLSLLLLMVIAYIEKQAIVKA